MAREAVLKPRLPDGTLASAALLMPKTVTNPQRVAAAAMVASVLTAWLPVVSFRLMSGTPSRAGARSPCRRSVCADAGDQSSCR
jgi:hypothetical protein